jgi:hypothetical protein
MGVDGERAVESITVDHWRAAARAVGLRTDLVIDRIREIGQRIAAAIDRVIAHPDGNDETRMIMTRLAEPVAQHVKARMRRL